MNQNFFLIVLLFLIACSSKKAQKEPRLESVSGKQSETLEILNELGGDFEKGLAAKDFWAKNYYESTQLILKNVSIKDNETDIWLICQGKTLGDTPGYHSQMQRHIKYLAKPLTFTTKGGFVKKIYVTRGMCRELGLYQNLVSTQDKPDMHQKFRKVLKEVTVEYVYTKNAYATKLVFGTTFDDVIFVVR